MSNDPQIQSGALVDERPSEEKEKDFLLAEAVADLDRVNWVEKPESEWRGYDIFNQNGSGSCVAQSAAKMLGIMYGLENPGSEYVHFSATDVYQRRHNRPAAGMNGTNALDIMRQGVTLEQLVPSQDMTDEEMDSVEIAPYKRQVGEVFKIDNYLVLSTGDIDEVASVMQRTGKPVMVWFYFTRDEWTDKPDIRNTDLRVNGSRTCRHSVVAVDFTLDKNGDKCLIIEDSWGPRAGKGGRRVITEYFFRARNFFAAYAINFKFEERETPPALPVFNEDMEFSPVVVYKDEVGILQCVLQDLGFFPNNFPCTGYYGAITRRAVGKFQEAHGVVDKGGPGYGRFGPKTRAKLREVLRKVLQNNQ